ncbi:MAG: DUF1189 family protein [Patescibacteria group bacterium]
MNKIILFFRALFQSSVDPSYYNDVIFAKSSFSLKYFFALNIFVVFVAASAVAFTLGRINVSEIAQTVRSVYPQNLSIQVKNGTVSLNRDLPFIVPLPKELDDVAASKSATASALAVFDTNDHMRSISNFWSYNALAVVTQNAVYYRKDADSREIRMMEIPRDASFDFSSSMLDEKIDSIVRHPFMANKWYIPVVSFLYFLVSFPFILFWSFLVSWVYALLSYILIRAFRVSRFSYISIWRLTLHALTPGIFLASLTDAFGLRVIHGVLFLLLYGMWMYIILKKLRIHETKPLHRRSSKKN